MNATCSAAAVQARAAPVNQDSRFTMEAMEREQALLQAMNLSLLMQWVEASRSLSEAISLAAQHDEQLREALDRWEIMYRAADWDDERSTALHGLLSLQHGLIAKAGGSH